jgi:hypothetical protein
VQTKGIHNIFNKIITENFTHSGTGSLQNNKQTNKTTNKIELPHNILSLKQQAQE